ncbi:hypothetical protein [Nonomuraea sp. 10N515B]|uniref:hypothetical protein n=1 Tax=Nonomuraea sp. 10N515B TaxID=3457422 RepID=UPI003FCE8557
MGEHRHVVRGHLGAAVEEGGGLGLACGVPPFASVWFERRMSRRAVEVAPEAV